MQRLILSSLHPPRLENRDLLKNGDRMKRCTLKKNGIHPQKREHRHRCLHHMYNHTPLCSLSNFSWTNIAVLKFCVKKSLQSTGQTTAYRLALAV